MKGKIDVKILTVLGLVIVLLYSGARTLGTVGASQKQSADWQTGEGDMSLEPVIRDLERAFSVSAPPESIGVSETTRDPLVAGKHVRPKKSSKSSKSQSSASASYTKRPRLTGLILDEDPVAIVEVGGRSFELKIGDTLEGKKVVDIDESGVHLLINGSVEILR